MKFQVQLFIRELHDGFFLIEVIGEESLSVYTEALDQAREDLVLVLSDRIERMNPGLLGQHLAGRDYVVHELEVEEALEVEGALGAELRPTRVSVLESRDQRWRRLWFPRWGVRCWVPVSEEVEEASRAFLSAHLARLTPGERLTLRYERREWLETLEIEAERSPLSAFTGKMLGVSMLPEPQLKGKKAEVEDEDEDEDKEAGEPPTGAEAGSKRADRKKRPPTPTMARLGLNMSRLARDGELERAYGRDREVGELLRLLGAAGTSIAVVGEPGVGKTTLLSELVCRIVDKGQPRKLRTRPVWFLDASRLIAGEGWFGDWQRQCLDVIQECIDAEVIWYVGPLLPLLDAGKSIGSQQNVALLLKPFLSGKRLTIVGECTSASWAKLELRDAGFARLFTPYRLEEPTPEGARGVLSAVAGALRAEVGVEVRPEGLRAVEELCRRFSTEGSALGRSVHFLRRLVDGAYAADREVVGRVEAVEQLCGETGLPAFIVRDDLPLDAESVWMSFRRRLIGQDEAVRRMTDLVSLIKSGLSDLGRPLGSFLFVGPTGVGKTEMAKALAEFLFGGAERLVRFDMSEFITADSVHRFLGAEGGQEGRLVSSIRRQPFSVVLLDEIETAHPAVFDVLLQVLGEARLTDQAGRTASFRNAVILMTSNLGVGNMREAVGFGGGQVPSYREHFMAEAERFFRPEFFNRIDYIVPFEPLGAEAIGQITAREVEGFLGREGIRQRELTVELDAEVSAWLAERGVEPRYGARPLKRLLERSLAAPLARHLSGGGGQSQRVAVGVQGEGLELTNLEPMGGGSGSARGRILKVLRRVGGVRRQAERWRASSPFRELVQDIRLLERLSQDRNFWKERARAQARMQRHEAERALRDDFEGLCDRIGSVEELAYEQHHERRVESLDALDAEIDEAVEALEALQWRLFARRFENPDKAVIYLKGAAGSRSWLSLVVDTYLRLAEELGWSVTGHAMRPDNPERAARASKVRVSEDPLKRPRKARREPDEPWSWVKIGDRFKADPEREGETRMWREQLQGALTNMDDERWPRALVVEGPGAACWLHGEGGLHQHVGVGVPPEQLRIRAEGMGLLQHLVAPERLHDDQLWPSGRKRLHHAGQRQIHDLGLGAHAALEPRVHRVWMRFMRAHMFDAVFGAGAHARFEGR